MSFADALIKDVENMSFPGSAKMINQRLYARKTMRFV